MPDARLRPGGDSAFASDPGEVALSDAKLRRLRPDLFGLGAWIKQRKKGSVGTRSIGEHLADGDSRAAVVASVDPLLVAATQRAGGS